MTFFRAGDDDAFRVIHDRYRGQLLTYVRHVMGATHADAEDVLQDVFVRAYRGLRAHDRQLNLSPWLYRVARNACIDELRRRVPVPYDELPGTGVAPDADPVLAESITRDRVRQLMSDLQQLPEQQRSALILCEVSGMSYADAAAALGTTVSAIKSLLVRARLGLAHALEARETACSEIRDELASAHARGERPNALVRRHVHDCQGCRGYGHAMRDRQRQLAALSPAMGPVAVVAKVFGWGGAGSGAGAAAAGGAGGTAAASGGLTVSAGLIGANAAHVLTVLAATTVVAAGAVGIKEATTTTKPVPPAAPVHVTAAPPATQIVTPATVAGSLRGAAAARVVIHRVDASGSNPPLGSGGTSHTTATAPVTPLGGSSAPAAPTQSIAPTTSSSSSSSCGIGQQSCASETSGTATTSPVTHTTTKVPLGSGGSSSSASSTRSAQLSTTPVGGGSESGSTAAPPASSSSESSAPLGSTSSPPLGS